ncbi:MAG: HU family DNA-binding protein [Holosporales bacterium]|jgi:DNA-binding protein HU-beta|nr:HU family DNA-binding protein [Holosporales bacterium]
MNRVELITNMAKISGLKKSDIDKALNAFIDVVTEELSRGEEIRLVGFGTFKVLYRAETEARNMKTGAPITIPARNTPKFKPGKQLKDAVAAGK